MYISITIFQLSSIFNRYSFFNSQSIAFNNQDILNFNSEGDEPYVGRVVYMFEGKMGYPTVHLEVRKLQYLVRAKRPLQATLSGRTDVCFSSWLAERLDRSSEILLLQ